LNVTGQGLHSALKRVEDARCNRDRYAQGSR